MTTHRFFVEPGTVIGDRFAIPEWHRAPGLPRPAPAGRRRDRRPGGRRAGGPLPPRRHLAGGRVPDPGPRGAAPSVDRGPGTPQGGSPRAGGPSRNRSGHFPLRALRYRTDALPGRSRTPAWRACARSPARRPSNPSAASSRRSWSPLALAEVIGPGIGPPVRTHGWSAPVRGAAAGAPGHRS